MQDTGFGTRWQPLERKELQRNLLIIMVFFWLFSHSGVCSS
jgi:hypothetical protein